MKLLLIGAFFSCLISGKLIAQATYPTGFTEEIAFDAFYLNAGMVHADVDISFVWELNGTVWLVKEGQVVSEPVIDISEEVGFWGDHGLISLALHPEFLSNGYIYLLYNVDLNYLRNFSTPGYDPNLNLDYQGGMGRITRYTLNTTDFQFVTPNSRHIVLGTEIGEGIPITAQSHGVGTLLFGEDGSLLVSTGDGNSWLCCYNGDGTVPEFGYDDIAMEDGILVPEQNLGAFRAQSIHGLNGKVLRIDPLTGAGLPGNPFFDPDSVHLAQSKVWALGFRNAFRMSLKPGTGEGTLENGYPGVLYVCDVGEGAWEEMNIVKYGGENFGWPIYQGPDKFEGYSSLLTVNPIAPNPLFDNGACDVPFFSFQDLLLQENAQHQYTYPNPCNPNEVIPQDQVKFVHTRGAMSYRNRWAGPPSTLLPGYDVNGNAMSFEISTDQGEPFKGVSGAGGVFLHGDKIPEAYQGRYVMGDYDGWVRAFDFDDNDAFVSVETWIDSIGRPVHLSFKESEGCIYLTSLFPSVVKRICFGGNLKPVIVTSPELSYGASPLQVDFDASQSYDPEGGSLEYVWDFGDNSPLENGALVSHAFETTEEQAQFYTVNLVVIDSAGAFSTKELAVSLNNTPPDAQIVSIEPGERYSLQNATFFNLVADIQDAEHSEAEMQIEWQYNLRHNNHFHLISTLPGNNQQINVLPTSCAEDEMYWYEIILRVTDPGGLSDTKSVMIYPDCDDLLNEQNALADNPYLLLPNPVKDMLTLRSQVDFEGAFEFEIFNTRGQRVQREVLPVFNRRKYVQLTVANLSSGLYILSFQLNGAWHQARFLKIDE